MLDRSPSKITNQLMDHEFTLAAWVYVTLWAALPQEMELRVGSWLDWNRRGEPLGPATELKAQGSFLPKDSVERRRVLEPGSAQVTCCLPACICLDSGIPVLPYPSDA